MLLGSAPNPAPPHPSSCTAWVFQHLTRVTPLTHAHPSFPHLPHPLRPARPICFGVSLLSPSPTRRHGFFQAPSGSQMLSQRPSQQHPNGGPRRQRPCLGEALMGDISLSRSPHSLLLSSPPPPSSETLTLRTSASSCLLLPFYLFARFLDCIQPLLSIPAWCFPPSTSAITTISPSS
jgi:hypothetical protein